MRASLKINSGQSRFSLNTQGKTSRPQIWQTYYLTNTLKKRCKKRDYKGIHDRFLRDHIFRGRMIENSRDEEVCRAWDVLADEDHTYHMSEEECFYYKNSWWISLNKSGNDTQPLRTRSDFQTSVVYIETFTPGSWRRPT